MCPFSRADTSAFAPAGVQLVFECTELPLGRARFPGPEVALGIPKSVAGESEFFRGKRQCFQQCFQALQVIDRAPAAPQLLHESSEGS